jgi:filamin
VTYLPIDAGTHVVSITLQGTPVAKSPYRVPVTRSLSSADPNYCVAYGPGLEKGYTSEPATFTVEARNCKGERLKTGGHPIDVDISDPKGIEIPVRIVDNRDGTYSVTYDPKEPGIHTVDVVVRNKFLPMYYDHIKDSPFKVKIDAGTDAGQSIAFGPGLQDGIPDTLPTHFTIQAKDRHGNNMKRGGDPFEVKIQGPKGTVDAKLTDNNDGTYTVDYSPSNAGKHRIDVNLKNQPIKDAPFTVLVREGADEAHSFIEGYTFTIRARSKKGENRKDGGDDFKVDIQGPSGPVPNVSLKDVGDGTYFCSYKLPGAGDYTVNVKLNGKHIKGSPWRQHV